MLIDHFGSLNLKWFVIGTKFLLRTGTLIIISLMHVALHWRDCYRLGVDGIAHITNNELMLWFVKGWIVE